VQREGAALVFLLSLDHISKMRLVLPLASSLLVGACLASNHDHQHALHHAHDHGDAEHMRQAHGVYRAAAQDGDNPSPLRDADLLQDELEGYFETPQRDSIFSGITTFAHLPFAACLSRFTSDLPSHVAEIRPGDSFDIAFVGMPFDTAVSFRPGARFGPSGIREGSRRISKHMGYNVPLGLNPFKSEQKIVDCGDIPVSAYNNKVAIQQMQRGYARLLSARPTTTNVSQNGKVYDRPLFGRKLLPKLLTLGGDHTIVLPILRALNKAYGMPISVIHFDSHLDTWKPNTYDGEMSINHGSCE
jgi:agmatinase